MQKISILLVDDDEVDREVIRKALHSLDAEIDEAINGTECLDKLKLAKLHNETYSLILLDYKLPDIDGLSLIKEVKKETISPIIIVTGFGNEDLVRSTALAGVLDYIPKDRITPEFLTRTVLNDLLIHKSQMEKAAMAMELERVREESVNALSEIIRLAKLKLAEYETPNS